MPTKRRKIEVHRLTVSGLPANVGYGPFLVGMRRQRASLKTAVWEHGEKSHALFSARIADRRAFLLFMSYTTGHRPDILDTDAFSVQPNPLAPAQTGVEWTHVLGGRVDGRYLLLVEKVQAGIWPGTIEGYLQWLVDASEHEEEEDTISRPHSAPVTISLEAEPGDDFIERLDSLSRIRSARLRIVRPNPGWKDLESEVSALADDSDAHKAELLARARPRASLDRKKGIIGIIRELFHRKELDFAEIEGTRGTVPDKFSSQKLGKHRFLQFPLDERGQVEHAEAWKELTKIHKELE